MVVPGGGDVGACDLTCDPHLHTQTTVPQEDKLHLKILSNEWYESMVVAHSNAANFHATYKTHWLLSHAWPHQKSDNHSEQQSERAHKWLAALFAAETNKNAEFVSQVATARNRHLAALLRRPARQPSSAPPLKPEATALLGQSQNTHRKRYSLWLDVNPKLQVFGLTSHAPEFELVSEDTLLHEHGFIHLFWAILVFLSPATADIFSVDALTSSVPHDDWPRLRLELTYGASIGHSSVRAAAAPYLHCAPFETCESFVEVEVNGELWNGRPELLFWCTTLDGTMVPMVFLRFLSLPITGLEREMLPLPSSFPIHQWEMTRNMGVHGNASSMQVTYGVVAASSVVCIVPTAFIGNFPSAVLPAVLKAAAHRLADRHTQPAPNQAQQKRRRCLPPLSKVFQQLRDGPLIAQNVHAYM